MDLFEALGKRRSVRSFDGDKPVTAEDEARLLEAACQAPSAGNVQPWRFFAVRDAALRARLMAAALGQPWVGEAPLVIVACADLEAHEQAYGRRGPRPRLLLGGRLPRVRGGRRIGTSPPCQAAGDDSHRLHPRRIVDPAEDPG